MRNQLESLEPMHVLMPQPAPFLRFEQSSTIGSPTPNNMPEFKSVALVGATGNIGIWIAKGLLARKEVKLRILTRPDSLTSKKDILNEFRSQGAEIVAVKDGKSVDEVAAALGGIQVVISAQGNPAGEEKLVLIDAAKKAGVSRFYISEFGFDHYDAKVQHPAMQAKRDQVKRVLDAGMESVAFVTGFFAEWQLSPFYTADFDTHTIEIVGDGNAKIGFCTLSQIGDMVAESINHPLLYHAGQKEILITVNTIVASWNEILDAHEKQTGSKWSRKHVPVGVLREKLDASNNPMADFRDYLRLWMAEGLGVVKNNQASQFKSVKPASFESLFKK